MTYKKPNSIYGNLRSYLVWAGIVVVGIGLLILAYRGIFNRFWADDWCYNAHFKNLGFVRTMQGYYDITVYASNRFSLTFFSGLFAQFGLFGVIILPSLVIILWVTGLFKLIGNLYELVNGYINRPERLLLSLILVYWVLFIAPNQFQILYWRSAVLPYTFPLLSLNFLLAALAKHIVAPSRKPFIGTLCGALTFMAVGFSEIGGTFILGILAILLVLLVLFHKRVPSKFNRATMPLIVSLTAGLVSLSILFFCPSNAPRQAYSYTAPTPLLELPLLTLRMTIQYIGDFFSSYVLPLAVLTVVGFLIAASRATKGDPQPIKGIKQAGILFLVTVGAFLACYAMLVPSAYIEKAIPEEGRALIIGTYTLSAATFTLSFLVGAWARSILARSALFTPRLLKGIAVFAFFALTAYTVRSYTYAVSTFEFFEKRAAVWDERDLSIKHAVAGYQTSVEVREIDSYMGVLELHPEPNWVNMCAADYYGVEEIRATLPWN